MPSPQEPTILNSKGKPMTLNQRESMLANALQKQSNALGYEIPITTLTTIIKRVVEQKFFEIPPADYMPVRVGEGAWSTNLVTFRSFSSGDDFTTGIINTGGNNSRLAGADAAIDSVQIKVNNWAKSIGWTLFDLQFAAKSGNWDVVEAKEKARKKNWDLGIQKMAFLGLAGDSRVAGLVNQTGITTNTTAITMPISSMTPDQLKAFLSTILDVYRANNNRTAWPNRFVIPESDYLGLVGPASSVYPVKSALELLEDAFKIATKKPDFKILPLAYLDPAYSGYAYHQYMLYNMDEEALRIDIPVDYTNTMANSIDNFSFQNVGYGQFTGVIAYRPLELMYFTY